MIVGQPLGSEIAGGSRQPLVESTAGVAAGRLAVAVWSWPHRVDPQILALVLLS
jgi:hypothetical protein